MNVDDVVAEKIAAARARAEAAKRRRAALAAARQRGLAARHAQKLRNLNRGETPTVALEKETT
jgi:biotin carboxylase